MIRHFPQWDALRVRTPIPHDLPGYQFVPYVPANLVYVMSTSGATLYCIDYENGQIVSEGQPLFGYPGGFAGTDTAYLPSFCPTDGTLATAIGVPGVVALNGCCGLATRHGDASMIFNVQFNEFSEASEQICDCANGPTPTVWYTTSIESTSGSQVGSRLCSGNKVTLVATTATLVPITLIGQAGGAGIDVDRAGNVYVYTSSSIFGTTVFERIGKWTVSDTVVPLYDGVRNGKQKLIVVGPPLQSGSVWFQSVYIASPTGWLSQHDCRTGTKTLGGATTIAAGWPYSLQAIQLNATADGLIVLNQANGSIEKLSYSTLGLIWRHTPPTLSVSRVCVTGGNDVLYTTTADANGAIHLRKLRSNDGQLMWDKSLFLPIGGSAIVSDSGRIGSFPYAGEQWVNAGQPPISF